jgi:hypothetical protein
MRAGSAWLAVPFVVVFVACSAPDPGTGIGSYKPHSGSTQGSTTGGGDTSNNGGTPNNNPTSSQPPLQPNPPEDAGGAIFVDSGGGNTGGGRPDAGGGTTNAKPGSCQNPICGTDGVECGCHATDSAGNTVEIGCQGGQCVCVINGQVDGQTIDDPNSCDSSANVKQDFLINCTCN